MAPVVRRGADDHRPVWLVTDTNTEHLRSSFRRFIGIDGYDLNDLIYDLARFTFLLGADDGGELLGLDST